MDIFVILYIGPEDLITLNIKTYCELYKKKLKEEIEQLPTQPIFTIIQVGDNEASNRYVRNKIKDCDEVGIKTRLYNFREELSLDLKLSIAETIKANKDVDAIMIQFPLPKYLDEKWAMSLIDPKKDADGFTNNGITNPATPQGIITYLERNNYFFKDKNALVIGRSEIVGKPMAKLLLEKNRNVMQIHSKTSIENKRKFIKDADLIICAAGHANTLVADDFKNCDSNKILFDVGINFDENGKLIGDCEKDLPVVYQSPVPGGVGLLTRLQLLENILKLYKYQRGMK